ncbi:hypothetical protein KCP73_03095 [Salmonella enterica subsp. enterica]|nr:hypothetical protein KCP73_03095 [Salmonella enterica subsp. enterica]
MATAIERYDPWNCGTVPKLKSIRLDNFHKMLDISRLRGWTALPICCPVRGFASWRPLSGGDGVRARCLDDVPEDELCGVAPGGVLPI